MSGADLEVLCESYLAAVKKGDRREALRLVVGEGVERGHWVVREAQRRIGELWEQGLVSVAREHVASAIAELALSKLYLGARRERSLGWRVVLACVEGELHSLPARMVADRLDLAGFEVLYAGANVPTAGLAELVSMERPDLVGLSVAMPSHLPALGEALAGVRCAGGAELLLAIGGRACSTERARELGAAVTGAEAGEVVAAAKAALAARGNPLFPSAKSGGKEPE